MYTLTDYKNSQMHSAFKDFAPGFIIAAIIFILIGALNMPVRTDAVELTYVKLENIDDNGNKKVTVTHNGKDITLDFFEDKKNRYLNESKKTIWVEYDPKNKDNIAYFTGIKDAQIGLAWILIGLGILLFLIATVSLLIEKYT